MLPENKIAIAAEFDDLLIGMDMKVKLENNVVVGGCCFLNKLLNS